MSSTQWWRVQQCQQWNCDKVNMEVELLTDLSRNTAASEVTRMSDLRSDRFSPTESLNGWIINLTWLETVRRSLNLHEHVHIGYSSSSVIAGLTRRYVSVCETRLQNIKAWVQADWSSTWCSPTDRHWPINPCEELFTSIIRNYLLKAQWYGANSAVKKCNFRNGGLFLKSGHVRPSFQIRGPKVIRLICIVYTVKSD